MLVACDDEELRRLVALIFKASAAYALTCASARGAIAVLGSFHPDLLFVALPLRDPGHALLRAAAAARVPVVAFDGDRSRVESIELARAGFSLSVIKELDVAEIQGAALSAIRHPRAA